jgi:type II secretory pathway component PulC
VGGDGVLRQKGDKLYVRRLFLAIKAGLVLVLLFLVFRTVTAFQQAGRILGPNTAAGTENAGEAGGADPAGTSVADYSAIIEQNIFGIDGSSQGQDGTLSGDTSTDRTVSAEEELGVVLIATVAGSPTACRAVVKDAKSGAVGIFRIGDTVEGARLESIERDIVVLEDNGRQMLLRRKEGRSTVSKNDMQTGADAQARGGSGASKASFKVRPVPPDDRAGTGPVETVLRDAVIETHTVNGRTEGLKVTGLEDIPAAKDLGLREGDVITVVNGQRLTSKQKAFQILKKARTQPTVNMKLLRGNKTKEMSFDLR